MGSIRAGFRPDINGIRAIAVLGVIAFHFQLGPLRAGGFAGVDVFFVVSGFLMTQIIVGQLDSSRFSLWAFLTARARRIVPAFVVTIVGVLLIGLVLLNPLQLEGQAERAAWSLVFLSNVFYAQRGNYFASPDQNWLLHTWSLSVEWQFYLIFPFLILLLRLNRAGRRGEVATLVVVSSLSFALMVRSLFSGGDSTTYNFYMLSSRAWEFLVGALVVYAMAHVALDARSRQVLHYAGMAAVFLAMLVFHNTTPWPSAWTALPVVGTAAMLLARHEAPRWSCVAPVRMVGLWSYSIYLWHWPIAAALRFFGHWLLVERLAGLIAGLALGAASYVLIEQRATHNLAETRTRFWSVGLTSVAGTIGLAALIVQTHGFETVRYATHPELLARLREYRTASSDWHDRGYCDQYVRRTAFLEECKFGNPKAEDVLVLGDSFAGQLTPRYKGAFVGAPFGITFVTRGGCAPLPDTETIEFGSICNKWTEAASRYALESSFKRVVFIAFWPYYEQGGLCLLDQPDCGTTLDPKSFAKALDERYRRLGDIWRKLEQQGKEVIIFGIVPIPGEQASPSKLYDKLVADGAKADIDMDLDAFARGNRNAEHRLVETATTAGATFVDPGPALCPRNKCPVLRDGRLLFADGHHFRASMMKDPRFAIFDRYIVPKGALRPTGR